MDDLADIALNSLEAAEAAETTEQDETNAQGPESDSNESEEPKDNNSTEDTEEAPESASDGEEDNSEEDSPAEGDAEEASEDKKEPEEKDDKEMSDEEFEKLAKKRGYSKKAEQDAEKQRQRQDRNALASATRRPKEVEKEVWDNMPAINKVIYNQLPYITAVGKNGNTIKVKTPTQLPEDFEFANKKAEIQFQSDMQEQTIRTDQYNNEIRGRIAAMREQEQRTSTARAIVSEVEALQKSGDLPTPKAKHGTKEFDTDEAVILTNKVLNYHAQRRAAGDRMSIKDALILYKAMNPGEFKTTTTAKGDSERKKVAKKISGVNKSADTSTTKQSKTKYFRPGMDVQDILDRALEDME